MEKKVLIGLLAVVACFSLGSTSFASNAQTPAVASSLTPLSNYYATINMKVGETTWVTGYSFWCISNENYSVDYTQSGMFVALNPGTSIIAADFGNGNTMYYTVNVE